MSSGLITALKNLFSSRSFSKISDTQELALVDTLALAMSADHDVSAVEREELTSLLRALDWNQSTALESYVEESLDKAKRYLAEPGGVLKYCMDISARLEEDWLREEAYYFAGRISTSDNRVDTNEHEFLQALVQALALDNDAQARIADQLLRETSF